jgi:hypothetical protein
MTEKIYIGIDPGNTGALAAIGVSESSIVEVALADYQSEEFLNLLRFVAARKLFEAANVTVVIEQVGMRPGQDVARQSVYVTAHGIVQGYCRALGIDYRLVHPRTWQKEIYRRLDLRPDSAYKDTKQRSLEIARRLFISRPDVISAITRRMDHNRADALLIAYYGILVSDTMPNTFAIRSLVKS